MEKPNSSVYRFCFINISFVYHIHLHKTLYFFFHLRTKNTINFISYRFIIQYSTARSYFIYSSNSSPNFWVHQTFLCSRNIFFLKHYHFYFSNPSNESNQQPSNKKTKKKILIFQMLRKIIKIVSCSSADEVDDSNIDPTHKAIREKERRQANNVRERYVMSTIPSVR